MERDIAKKRKHHMVYAREQKKIEKEHDLSTHRSLRKADALAKKYDPLEKDTDHDGISDKLDHNFMDSDYYSSVYDEKDKANRQTEKYVNTDFTKENVIKSDDRRRDTMFTPYKKSKSKVATIHSSKKKAKSKPTLSRQASPIKSLPDDVNISPKTVSFLSAAMLGNKARSYTEEKLENESDENVSLEAVSKASKTQNKVVSVKRAIDKRKQTKAIQKTKNESVRLEKQRFNSGLKQELKKSKSYQKSKGLNKYYQKRKIKRAYKKKRYGSFAKRTFTKTKNKAAVLLKTKSKKLLLILLALLLLLILFFSILSSMFAMFSASTSALVSSSYQASDIEITKAELEFTRFEALLTKAIEETEENESGYDAYRYHLDTIYHDPHILISYLTAKYGKFNASMVADDIEDLFGETYTLTREVVNEPYTTTTTYTDAGGNTHTITTTHDWYVLVTTLKRKDLGSICTAKLTEKQKELYDVTLSTNGNFDNFPSPIRADWKPLLTSPFGYRIHPIRNELHLHTGMDIGSPLGTDLRSIFEGSVIKTGVDEDGYGNYIIIEDENGYKILYAHCSSVLKSEGDKVISEEVVAKMGSTGSSTGSHLHMEIMDNEGNLLNPYFYLSSSFTDVADVTENQPDVADTTCSEKEEDKVLLIAPTGTFSDDVDDETSKLFKEINKHLGKPYEFGATGPDRFDCSSFVCYSYTQSEYFNTGSLSAQGLYNRSRPVEKEDLRQGDLIFFTETYDADTVVTHVGIYAGENFMVHAGDPIKFSKFDTDYFKEHFYSFGRIKED